MPSFINQHLRIFSFLPVKIKCLQKYLTPSGINQIWLNNKTVHLLSVGIFIGQQVFKGKIKTKKLLA